VPLIRLDDNRYELADFDRLVTAAQRDRRQYQPEFPDCDDYTESALWEYRRTHGNLLPPAIGRVTGRVGGYEHAVLYCVESGTARVRFYDPVHRRELFAADILAREASDH